MVKKGVLTEKDEKRLYEIYKNTGDKISKTYLAKLYGIGVSTVHDIIKRQEEESSED